MKINGNSIRVGNVIEHKGNLWVAVKTQHTQPGKGGAYLQVELKNLRDGTKLNERFRSSESVERARLDEVPYQFLFSDGDLHTFMHPETFEQITLTSNIIGEESLKYLKEGIIFILSIYEEEVVSASPPETIVLQVVEADSVVKGQTASSSYKPSVLENNMRLMVPPHIAPGTKVIVRTEDDTYLEKYKES